MSMSESILIAVDDTEASRAAVEHVRCRIAAEEGDYRLCLLNVLPPVPPSLREFGGAEDPQEEHRRQERLDERERQWLEQTRRQHEAVLEEMRETLVRTGIDGSKIETATCPQDDEGRLAEAILKKAREGGFDTVVVGHHSLPWYRELFERHVGEELSKQAEDLTVQVVD